MYPPSAQANPSVARAVEQVLAEHPANVRQNFRIAGGVEAVASEIDLHAREREAAGIAADGRVALN
jgi:hypothetical protein